MAQATCSVEGCEDPIAVKARSLCATHYQRAWKVHRKEWKAEWQAACTVKGCQRRRSARGLCGLHYQRWKKSGDPGDAEPLLRSRAGFCQLECCPRRSYARGWCRLHYDRWRRDGTPGAIEAYEYAGYINRNGYVEIRVNKQTVFQHRHVLEQQLGRPLLPEEHVHHKNGIRQDNRPKNLELWVTWGKQPNGQRVEDLVAFVVEHYPDQVAEALRRRARPGSGRPPQGVPHLGRTRKTPDSGAVKVS